MLYIEGQDRNQATMFPEVLDDYVGENNPVRFIDAYVDGLDLVAMGFTYSEPEERGRKPYNPKDMLNGVGENFKKHVMSRRSQRRDIFYHYCNYLIILHLNAYLFTRARY